MRRPSPTVEGRKEAVVPKTKKTKFITLYFTSNYKNIFSFYEYKT
jgi:hypothetical protein